MLSGMALKQSGAKKASARPLRLSERSGGTVCAEFGTVWCMFMGYFLVGAYSRPALGDVACGEWHGLALPLRVATSAVPTANTAAATPRGVGRTRSMWRGAGIGRFVALMAGPGHASACPNATGG